MVVSSPWW